MDARLVRAYLDGLPATPPDGRSIERVRNCLESLQRPDVRYLVAAVVGAGAEPVARICAAILRTAGASTGVLGRSLAEATIDGSTLDDALLAEAGTLAAGADYRLRSANAELGEVTQREAVVLVALTAFAESNVRVALLLDADARSDDPSHAPAPDVVVATDIDGAAAERAMALVPDGRPAVVGDLPEAVRSRAERIAEEAGVPMLLGGRDHAIVERSGKLEFSVRGEPYVLVDRVPGTEDRHVSTGIAAALALGVMGIRMREEWVQTGIASLHPDPVAR